MSEKTFALDLIDFIESSNSMYHTVLESTRRLDKAGFKELKVDTKWELEPSTGYYVNIEDSAVFAFKTGNLNLIEDGFKIIGSHTDSPGFRIKPQPLMNDRGLVKLNTEVYGGPIFSTWMDRPLSMAGRVILNDKDGLQSRMIDIDKDLFIIPNLAIHMNREVNKGFEFNPQKHLLPLFESEDEWTHEDFVKLLADSLEVEPESIYDFDLYLYDRSPGSLIGLNEEWIHVGKLDNLAMVHASLEALIESVGDQGIHCVFLANHEEIGSRSMVGADSDLLPSLLKRIAHVLTLDYEEFLIALDHSFMISADMAHAYHPNFSDVADPTHKPQMNKGPVIKVAANRSYTSDGYSSAYFKRLCDAASVNYQVFTNASDRPGGSTIGPLSEGRISIRGVDVGNPIWGMHSVAETGGVNDHHEMFKVFKTFFNF